MKPCATLVFGLMALSLAAQLPPLPDGPQRAESSLINWQAQFGPVDFTKTERWNWMIGVHPQPLNSFKAFDREVLSADVKGDHQGWIRAFFKGSFLNALTNLAPARYYVNEGRGECSLLYLELEFQENRVSIQESYQALLLTIQPRGFDATKGIDREFVGKILFEWVNLNKRQPPIRVTLGVPGSSNYFVQDMDESDPFTIPYKSVFELMDSFKLPPQLKVGETFSNLTNAAPDTALFLNYWPGYVVGFVGSNGVSVFLLKSSYGGPRIGRLHDYNWLNKGLYQADGKTLVDSPKNRAVNESPELREPSRLR